MKKTSLTFLSPFICFLCVSFLQEASAQSSWNLPLDIHDSNTQISFSVDSTWHEVHGATANLGGKVWLEDASDPNSVRAEIVLPVAKFDTGSKSRDREMRNVMAAEKMPNVVFRLDHVQGLPAIANVEHGVSYPIQLQGRIEIRGTQRDISAAGTLREDGETFLISGDTTLRWNDFGVEDPSILIARLDSLVKIHFEVRLQPDATLNGVRE